MSDANPRDREFTDPAYVMLPPMSEAVLHGQAEGEPSGFENYMRDLAAAAQEGPLTPETMRRVASRYDFEPV